MNVEVLFIVPFEHPTYQNVHMVHLKHFWRWNTLTSVIIGICICITRTHLQTHDIADIYIYIHACALNRENVAEQSMGLNRNTYTSIFYFQRTVYINEYPYRMRDSGLKRKKYIGLPWFEPIPPPNCLD